MSPTGKIFDLFGDERNVDPFRLTILGFASIEETLTEALDDALGGELRHELHRMPFKTQVALAIALELMPNVFRAPLGRLADLRHKFAHGDIDRLTPSHGRELYASQRELAPDIDKQAPGLADLEPELQLVSFLALLEVGLLASIQEAHETRARADEAMREWWERHAPVSPLSGDEIRKLFPNL